MGVGGTNWALASIVRWQDPWSTRQPWRWRGRKGGWEWYVPHQAGDWGVLSARSYRDLPYTELVWQVTLQAFFHLVWWSLAMDNIHQTSPIPKE